MFFFFFRRVGFVLARFFPLYWKPEKVCALGREFWERFEIVTSITDFKLKVSDFVEVKNWGVSEVLVKCELLQIQKTVSTCQSVNLSIVVPFEMLVPTRCPQRAFVNLLWYSSGARAPFPSKHNHDESFDRRRPGSGPQTWKLDELWAKKGDYWNWICLFVSKSEKWWAASGVTVRFLSSFFSWYDELDAR